MKLPKILFKLVSTHRTSLGNNEAFPPEEDYSFDYKILKKRFVEVTDNISHNNEIKSLDEKYLIDLHSKLMHRCKEKEENIKENLIKLCENIVNETLQVPDDTVILNCKLVNKINPIHAFRLMPEESNLRNFDFEDLDDFNNASKVILKRRLINSLIQGASYNCCMLYKKYLNEISNLDNELPSLYEKIILINDYLLFTKKEKLNDKSAMQGSCVEVMLGRDGEKTEINVQGLIFPFLLNETFRGFFELFASQGLPTDLKKANYIINQADFLIAEPWDLRMGVGLWNVLSKSVSDTKVLPFFFSSLCRKSVDEFNSILREIFANTKKGQRIKQELYHNASHDMSMNDLTNTIKQKNADSAILNDSYISSDELDKYTIGSDGDGYYGKVIQEDNNDIDYVELISNCTIDDIDFHEEQDSLLPQFNMHTYIKDIEIPTYLINYAIEPRDVYTRESGDEPENLYQVHIFLDKSIQHLGLAYKIYCKSIMLYGNIYSGYRKRLNNNEIPKIWDKLKNNFNVTEVISANGQPLGIKATLK